MKSITNQITMKKLFAINIILCLMIPGLIYSQSLPEKLQGSWEGKGTLMGSEADFRMNWDMILNDQFLQLTFTSKRLSGDQEILFHAKAIYKPEDESWNGTWFDSRGISFEVNGTVEENKLSVEWGSPDIEQGRTVYELTNEHELTVTDFINQDGTYSKFGESVYHRVGFFNDEPKVIGIGGVFFKTDDVQRTRQWYKDHLGIANNEHGGSFVWRKFDSADDFGFTVWHAFPENDDYFNLSEKEYMINYRVNNLDALINQLEREGVELVGEVEEYPFGKFAWILDPNGQKIELWEPYDAGFFNIINADGTQMYNTSN